MAHNLAEIDGKVSFFTAKEKAWHGLGTVVDRAQTSKEAIVVAGLDYDVAKKPIYTMTDGEFVEVQNKFATYRTDTDDVFGVVGSRYNVVQNSEAFGFFDAIVGNDEAMFETAGALKNGEIIFITAKLPSHILVGDDVIDNYLMLTSSHDGTKGIQVMFTPIRVVCSNTLNAALHNNKYKVNITHTASANDNLREAHKVMGISNMLTNELSEVFNAMSSVKVNDNTVKKYVIDSLSLKMDLEGNLSTRGNNIVNEVMEYYEVGPGQDTSRGTVWGMYNAVTGFYQNVKKFKTAEDKMVQTLFGNVRNKTDKAFQMAVKMVS